jgi:hypothetical protein
MTRISPDTAGQWCCGASRSAWRGQPDGGYADVYELICCDCGDDPDLDYRQVSSELRQIRGPYPFAAGIAAYESHVERHHRRQATASPGRGAAAPLAHQPGWLAP